MGGWGGWWWQESLVLFKVLLFNLPIARMACPVLMDDGGAYGMVSRNHVYKLKTVAFKLVLSRREDALKAQGHRRCPRDARGGPGD